MFTFTPVHAINLGFFSLSTHGLMIAIGFVVAELLARLAAKKKGIDPGLVDNAAIIAVIAGLLGARLVYILAFGQGMTVWQMLAVWQGGLSSHGGYIFGIIAGLLYVKIKKIDVLKFSDAVLPYLLIGWAIGRIGCFLNWDSFGKVTASAWAIVVYGEPRYPTQLFESVGCPIFFFLHQWFVRRPWFAALKKGSAAALALIAFVSIRFIVDFFRGDPVFYLLLSRVLTVTIAIASTVYIFWASKRQ